MTTSQSFQLSLDAIEADLVRVRASGEISEWRFNTADPFAAVLGADYGKHRVLLDLENTTYLDSSGVGWLVKCHTLFTQAGGQLVLHSVPPTVLGILRFCHLVKSAEEVNQAPETDDKVQKITFPLAADLTAARALALEGGQP